MARWIGRRPFLGELLLAQGAVTEEQLATALAEQRNGGHFLGDVLIRFNIVNVATIESAISAQAIVPFVIVGAEPISAEILELVPADMCRRLRLLPVHLEGPVLRVAMANPFDTDAKQLVEETAGYVVFPMLASVSDLTLAIDRCC